MVLQQCLLKIVADKFVCAVVATVCLKNLAIGRGSL